MNKVQTGDPIQIKAATWNSFIDAAEYVKNLQSDQCGGPLRNGNYSGVVLLKNGESTLFPRFSAMAITDVLIRPDANEPEFTGKCPAFLGRKVTNAYEEYPYAVLLEPVDAGKIGRALLLGIVPAKVSILDPEHKFAEPMIGNASGASSRRKTVSPGFSGRPEIPEVSGACCSSEARDPAAVEQKTKFFFAK